MRKRLLWLMITVIVGILAILTGSPVGAHAQDITGVTKGLDAPIKVEEAIGGQYVDITQDYQSGKTLLTAGNYYQLTYDWSINDHQKVSAGDTATVTMPKTSTHGSLGFDVTSVGSKQTVGKFNAQASTAEDALQTGTITFNDQLAQTNVGRAGKISFTVSGTQKDTTDPSAGHQIIAKGGWVPDNSTYTGSIPDTVVWQLVINPDRKDLGDVTIKDDLDGNLTFDGPKSVSAHVQDADDNNIAEVTPTVTSEGSEITFVLKHVTQKISLTYTTTPKYDQLGTATAGYFSNYADLTSTSGAAGNTGSGSTSSNPVYGSDHKDIGWGGKGNVGGGYRGSVTLTKVDADDPAKVLPGAVYELREYNTATKKYDRVSQSNLTTDHNGQTSSGLSIGEYEYVETKAPDGYQLDTTPLPFVISPNTAPVHQTVTARDQQKPVDNQGSVTLTKVDATSKQALAGAVFSLQKKTGESYQDVANETTLTTDASGQLNVTGLSAGTYHFTEITPPTGYVKSQKPTADFTITAGSKDHQTVTVEDIKTPTANQGSAMLTKIDAASNAVLPGATFKLQRLVNGHYQDVADKTGLVTDAQGQITVAGLSDGDYQFVETQAPEGYDKNADGQPFTITAGATAVQKVIMKDVKTKTPPKATGSAILIKEDATDAAKRLPGAVFKLQEQNEQGVYVDYQPETTVTTAANGQVKVTNLPVGNYQFVETVAPEGYQLDKNIAHRTHPFTIATGQTVPVTVTVQDAPTGTPTPPNNEAGSSSNSSGVSSSSNVPSSSSVTNSSSTVPPVISSSELSSSEIVTSTETTGNSSSQPTTSTTTKTPGVTPSSRASHTDTTVNGGADGSGVGSASGDRGTARESHPIHHRRSAGVSRLPQTSEQKAVAVLFGGFLLLGSTLSYLQWRRNRS